MTYEGVPLIMLLSEDEGRAAEEVNIKEKDKEQRDFWDEG